MFNSLIKTISSTFASRTINTSFADKILLNDSFIFDLYSVKIFALDAIGSQEDISFSFTVNRTPNLPATIVNRLNDIWDSPSTAITDLIDLLLVVDELLRYDPSIDFSIEFGEAACSNKSTLPDFEAGPNFVNSEIELAA